MKKPEKKTNYMEIQREFSVDYHTASDMIQYSDRNVAEMEAYYEWKIKEILEGLKLPKCGKTYDCDSCPYNNDNECNIHQFNQRIDQAIQALEKKESNPKESEGV